MKRKKLSVECARRLYGGVLDLTLIYGCNLLVLQVNGLAEKNNRKDG